ncbi:hypothetical protein [Legionella sp. W05-934-2]|uniref:hypothetical protein n=1 Tax=Legionella sp. W05-934-2 TaxID=1198649 RepID=UPI003461FF49
MLTMLERIKKLQCFSKLSMTPNPGIFSIRSSMSNPDLLVLDIWCLSVPTILSARFRLEENNSITLFSDTYGQITFNDFGGLVRFIAKSATGNLVTPAPYSPCNQLRSLFELNTVIFGDQTDCNFNDSLPDNLDSAPVNSASITYSANNSILLTIKTEHKTFQQNYCSFLPSGKLLSLSSEVNLQPAYIIPDEDANTFKELGVDIAEWGAIAESDFISQIINVSTLDTEISKIANSVQEAIQNLPRTDLDFNSPEAKARSRYISEVQKLMRELNKSYENFKKTNTPIVAYSKALAEVVEHYKEFRRTKSPDSPEGQLTRKLDDILGSALFYGDPNSLLAQKCPGETIKPYTLSSRELTLSGAYN